MTAPNASFDPVAYLTAAFEEMNACAERAALAATSGNAPDALSAIGTMQSLLLGRETILRQIAAMLRTKRVHPERRAAIRNVVTPALETFGRHLRVLEAHARAAQVRAEAVREALRAATSTHSTYTAGPYGKVKMVRTTHHHSVAITA